MSCCSCNKKYKCGYNKVERTCVNCFYDGFFVDLIVTLTDPCDTCKNESQFRHKDHNE